MEFTIYRDLASIMFVRCMSPIPGSRIYAEGTGFSLAGAIARCRSEAIEGRFQLSHPLRHKMLGIAAHPDAEASEENARNEALETLVLGKLATAPVFYGISFPFFQTRLCLGRVENRFIALALFVHQGTPTATQAVSKNPLKALIKAWAEVRNLRLYSPPPIDLPAYTKANGLLSSLQLGRIVVKPSCRKQAVVADNLKKFQHKDQDHYVTYFIKENQS